MKLSHGESMRGEREEYLDHMRRPSHAKRGGTGGKGARGGRSSGGGGAQAAREPRNQLTSDAPSLLWLSVSFTRIFFHELLVSVLFF